jgi:hypothetical protein
LNESPFVVLCLRMDGSGAVEAFVRIDFAVVTCE